MSYSAMAVQTIFIYYSVRAAAYIPLFLSVSKVEKKICSNILRGPNWKHFYKNWKENLFATYLSYFQFHVVWILKLICFKLYLINYFVCVSWYCWHKLVKRHAFISIFALRICHPTLKCCCEIFLEPLLLKNVGVRNIVFSSKCGKWFLKHSKIGKST